jgi:hypothetical protein
MSEGTVISILTFGSSIYVRGTELSLILIRMIEFLNSIMSFLTHFPNRAFLSFSSKMAHFGLVNTQGSPLIFLLVVIIGASFKVVAVRIYLTKIHLKKSQVQK